jgi:hypothetical protein
MSNHGIGRRIALVAALVPVSLALAGGAAGSGGGGSHASAIGVGRAQDTGTTKHFAFAAFQQSSVTLAATGYAALTQDDPTNVFGDFRLHGPVKCLRVTGNYALIGITIQGGTGTAATHVGETFYIAAVDGKATNTPDLMGNSGYAGMSPPDCTVPVGTSGVVDRGDVVVRG